MLGDGGENMQGQAGGMRYQRRQLRRRNHQRGDKRQIAREAVQLGDDQSGLALARKNSARGVMDAGLAADEFHASPTAQERGQLPHCR
jgi:hypothetical protein